MNQPGTFLQLGSPRFSDDRLSELARTQGAETAWRHVLPTGTASGIVAAMRGVSGHFAVGLRLPAGQTLIAVDRFATLPLCYRIDQGKLQFGSRADELADSDTSIDPQAIFDYLYFHVIPSPRTIYQEIFRLPAGHFALFDGGKLTVAPYWTPAFVEARNPSFEALKAEFKGLLKDAVAAQLDGSKPACFLSGGTDSSTVAGMVAQSGDRQVATYSIGFDAQGYDEMEFARLAARHFKAEHHEYYVTPADLVRSIPAVAAHFDQPFGNSSAVPAYYCAKMAREDGATRLLAGDGGDELFGGNSRYAKQRVFGLYGHLPRLLQKNVMEPVLGTRAAAAFPLTRKAGSYVEQARVPMPDRLQMYNLVMRLGVDQVLTDAMRSRINIELPLLHQREVWQMTSDCSHLNQELAFDWRFTLAESDLPKVNGATGLAGMEVAYPMLDDRLLNFSLGLPTQYKLKGLRLRWFFKEALRGFLPDAIITKKKQGFGLPFGVWANQNPALKSLARESLESLSARGVVRADFVHTLLTRRLPEHPGYFGEMVWILMMLEQWLQARKPTFAVA
jgi:asparagine synthase (glutamine-hydrolysing)